MSEFKEKIVVVTGGANGIGKCIADEFTARGAIYHGRKHLRGRWNDQTHGLPWR